MDLTTQHVRETCGCDDFSIQDIAAEGWSTTVNKISKTRYDREDYSIIFELKQVPVVRSGLRRHVSNPTLGTVKSLKECKRFEKVQQKEKCKIMLFIFSTSYRLTFG